LSQKELLTKEPVLVNLNLFVKQIKEEFVTGTTNFQIGNYLKGNGPTIIQIIMAKHQSFVSISGGGFIQFQNFVTNDTEVFIWNTKKA
jgi:hypothetical protein